VIIPVLGACEYLKPCLSSVINQSFPCSQVIVVLQGVIAEERRMVEAWIGDSRGVELLELSGCPSKVRAVRLGLSKARSKWVLLLDTDTVLFPNAVEELLHAVTGYDAAYGIIVPRPATESSLLDAVVKSEKLLSHGLWRLGRWALNVGPNLPGQCYIIRRSVLKATYTDDLGYLDDVALTGCLLAERARINFAPVLVASESSRSTWLGLLLQRVRYTMGLVQSFVAVHRCGDARVWAWFCLSLHAWLYYGSCITAFGLAAIFLTLQWWVGAALFISAFLAERCIFAFMAASALRKFRVPLVSVWPGWMLIPSVLILVLVKVVGAGITACLFTIATSGRSNPSMYRR
jgi:cellulose synthase/poly-beta-1,6-N-acetylglucosamine synthase-like glycosyltransferase